MMTELHGTALRSIHIFLAHIRKTDLRVDPFFAMYLCLLLYF